MKFLLFKLDAILPDLHWWPWLMVATFISQSLGLPRPGWPTPSHSQKSSSKMVIKDRYAHTHFYFPCNTTYIDSLFLVPDLFNIINTVGALHTSPCPEIRSSTHSTAVLHSSLTCYIVIQFSPKINGRELSRVSCHRRRWLIVWRQEMLVWENTRTSKM